jgi:hypothetical protein
MHVYTSTQVVVDSDDVKQTVITWEDGDAYVSLSSLFNHRVTLTFHSSQALVEFALRILDAHADYLRSRDAA